MHPTMRERASHVMWVGRVGLLFYHLSRWSPVSPRFGPSAAAGPKWPLAFAPACPGQRTLSHRVSSNVGVHGNPPKDFHGNGSKQDWFGGPLFESKTHLDGCSQELGSE